MRRIGIRWLILLSVAAVVLPGPGILAQPAGSLYLVKDFNPGPDAALRRASHGPRSGFAHNGLFYFVGSTSPTYPKDGGGSHPSVFPRTLAVSDGTWDGTKALLPVDDFRYLGTRSHQVIFSSAGFGEWPGRRLYVTDGTAAGTRELETLRDAVDTFPGVEIGKFLVFGVERANGVRELWRTDATTAGTARVDGLLPSGWQPYVSHPMRPHTEGRILFLVVDGSGRRNLVESDLSPSGTRLVFSQLWLDELGSPEEFVVAGDKVFVRIGRRLYVTEGNEIFTELLADIPLLGGANEEMRLYGASQSCYVLTNATATTLDVWRSDGSPDGTVLIRRLHWLWSQGRVGSVAAWQDKLFFVELGDTVMNDNEPSTGSRLWASDGSTAGTLPLWGQPAELDGLLATGRGVLFGTDDSGGPPGLYLTDGTVEGTQNLYYGYFRPLAATPKAGTPHGELLFLTGRLVTEQFYGRELWVSDWTSHGTRFARDLSAAGFGVTAFDPRGRLGERVLFNDGIQGNLWVTNGSDVGTIPIGSTNRNFGAYCFAEGLHAYDPELVTARVTSAVAIYVRGIICKNECCDVAAEDESRGSWFDLIGEDECEPEYQSVTLVWRTDGTIAGTVYTGMVLDYWLWFPYEFRHGALLWAPARSQGSGENVVLYPPRLYMSGGTAVSTVAIDEFACVPDSKDPEACPVQFIPLGKTTSHAFFTVLEPKYPNDPTRDRIFYGTNGLLDGTDLLRPLLTTDGVSESVHLTGAPYNERFYFSPTIIDTVGEPFVEGELWSSAGTLGTTQPLMTVRRFGQEQALRNFNSTADWLFFTGNDNELWVSNGTTLHTMPMATVLGRESFRIEGVVGVVNNRLIVVRDMPDTGRSMWTTDGTLRGTGRLPDPVYGMRSMAIHNFTPLPGLGLALFGAGSARTGIEMHATDGTPGGTFRVREITPGPFSSNPRGFTEGFGTVLFQATTPDHGTALWALITSAIKKPPTSIWTLRGNIITLDKAGEQ
ncbi:MAG: hypothetical protein KF858_09225 [Candidatus Sumerlaeia bacterium]|nr:hypothetical protein [Candidatus Sumerlaeia bacterium]